MGGSDSRAISSMGKPRLFILKPLVSLKETCFSRVKEKTWETREREITGHAYVPNIFTLQEHNFCSQAICMFPSCISL